MKWIVNSIACLLLVPMCWGQKEADSSIRLLSQQLINTIQQADKNHIYIITNKNVFFAGETVYFKVYLVDSLRSYLQAKPKKVFIDLINRQDSVLSHLILDASHLNTSGHFNLPDSLKESYYWLRSYTTPIAANSPNNMGVAPVYVMNSYGNKDVYDSTSDIRSPGASKHTFMSLFPEGGTVISGLNSTVAIKLWDEYKRPVSTPGLIKDNHDSVIAKFTTNRDGLAQVSYFPVWYKKYRVFIKNDNLYDSIGTWPHVNFSAAQVAITARDATGLTARIALEDSIYKADFVTHLVAVSGDSLCFASQGKGMYYVTVPLAKFPPGIARLYLFDAERHLLSERAVYINKPNYHLRVQTNKTRYAAREKIQLLFSMTDVNDTPELATFTVSVLDKNIADSVLNVWQSDELKGLSDSAADLVMLTQRGTGSLLQRPVQQPEAFVDEDSSLKISGRILSATNKPVESGIITLVSAKPDLIIASDTTDANGKFEFHLNYSDSTRFAYQLTDRNGQKQNSYQILFDPDATCRFQTPESLKTLSGFDSFFQATKSRLQRDTVLMHPDRQWLKPVIVKSHKSKKTAAVETKRMSQVSHIITRDKIGEGANMIGQSLFHVPGIRLMNGFVIILAPNDASKVSASDEPLILLDGAEVETRNMATTLEKSPVLAYLNSLPLSMIDFIEVLTGPEAAIAGMRGGNGIISITTKAGSGSVQQGEGLKSVYAPGFHTERPFNSPDYANPERRRSKTADLRKTIYWNGDVITDKEGKAIVEFYAADTPAIYVITIIGLTAHGDKVYYKLNICVHE